MIIVDSTAPTPEDAISELADKLISEGYAKATFKQAVLVRENSFPTGLPVYPVGVAIPHTDGEHIIASAVAVSILSQPVPFYAMGNPENLVAVNVVFMLAMKEAHAQLELLKSLIQFIQDQRKLAQLLEAANTQEVLKLIQSQ